MTDPLPGDVLTVRSTGWAARLIRLGAALRDKPNLSNHVAVMTHWTEPGHVPWGVEGKPGGVDWVDLRKYLANRSTLTNYDQPKTDEQRAEIVRVIEVQLGKAYDWLAIAGDFFESMHIRDVYARNWKGQGAPSHFVCSSLAAYVYEKVGLKNPDYNPDRLTTPGDWSQFILDEAWLTP